MKIGTQIRFKPNGEIGFITEDRGDYVFVRFWSKHAPGQLRTMANSESCYKKDIEEVRTDIPEEIIEAWLEYLGYMTYEEAAFVKLLKSHNNTYRVISWTLKMSYPKRGYVGDNQIEGQEACEEAVRVLGEDPNEHPWN